ncbi:MAG: hypothetical protein QXQ79_01930 [Candidatus Nanoarchaeia archaeon]
MAKKYLVILAVLFSLLIVMSGCVQKPKEQKIPEQTSFIGGTQGIKMSFLESQPPATVYANQDFQIGLKLENVGESEPLIMRIAVGEGKIWGILEIKGVDVNRFALANEVTKLTNESYPLPPAKLIGKQKVPGGQAFVTFSPKAPSIAGASAKYPLEMVLIYGYKTIAATAVCLKENLYQQTTGGKEICKLTGQKQVSNSGAPIQVTYFEQFPTGFKFVIKNVGNGYPFYSNERGYNVDNEASIDVFKDKYRVYIENITLGDKELTNCDNKTVYLQNNEAQFYCNYNFAGGREYVEQLTITLKYGYVDRISKEITVERYE